MITISHIPAEGTLIHGTTKGDGTAEIIKAHRLRWFPSLGMWGIPQSRDKAAQTHRLNALRDALTAAGHDAEVLIEDETRTFAEVEAGRYERAEDRAERKQTQAEKAAARSDAAEKASRAISDHIPMGQPILVGHHSERRHRRDIERMHNNDRRSLEEHRKAESAAAAAERALREKDNREDVPTTLRRIERLSAELRRYERGGYAEDKQAALREEIAYWEALVEDKKAAGVKVWGPDDFAKGDAVQVGHGWYRVVRVNKKSLSVQTRYSWTDTIPYNKVRGQRPASPAT